jgi:HAMP domain-containing protein
MPFEPESPTALLILFSVSLFVVIAFLVFGFVLLRNLFKLWADRRAGQMGSRFRTKMVFGAMGISLLPVALLFVVSYALLNRTLTKWFPHALEVATDESVRLLTDISDSGAVRRAQFAREIAPLYAAGEPLKVGPGYDAIWRLDFAGRVTDALFRDSPGVVQDPPHWVRTLPSGAEAWQSGRTTFLAARAPLPSGALLIAQRMPDNYLSRLDTILGERRAYLDESRQLKAFRLQMLLSLLLITLLLLFSTTWVALFLEKQVTVPVQALAEATREISHGNLEHRVTVRAQDELGILVDSFNRMTGQLRDARERLEESNANLQRLPGDGTPAPPDGDHSRKHSHGRFVPRCCGRGGTRECLRGADVRKRGHRRRRPFARLLAGRGSSARRGTADAAFPAHGRGVPGTGNPGAGEPAAECRRNGEFARAAAREPRLRGGH